MNTSHAHAHSTAHCVFNGQNLSGTLISFLSLASFQPHNSIINESLFTGF